MDGDGGWIYRGGGGAAAEAEGWMDVERDGGRERGAQQSRSV